MDTKLYKICDRCDHGMSNKMLKDKLKSDIEAELITLKDEKSTLEKLRKKVKDFKQIVSKNKRVIDSRIDELESKDMILLQQVNY